MADAQKPDAQINPDDPKPKTSAGRSTAFYLFGIGALVAATGAVWYFHTSRNSEIAGAREARAAAVDRGPRVEVVNATKGPERRTLTLLADVRPNQVATLYGKVSGYMKTVNVDRGDKVEAGQIVALIESPELEFQYNAAVTDLEHKRRNLERSKELFAKGNTTQVALLQFETDARVAEANVTVLATTKGYQTIRAPFAGRVTNRFVDPGALVTNAQTNIVSALPVMTISDDSRLRVYAYVQQADVPFVNIGDDAEVVDASNPDRKVKAKVTRMTGELDPRARAMQIEVNIDNSEGFLASGSFAYVTIHIPIKSYPQIPVSGLIVRGSDNFVAVLDKDTVRFKPVRVASTDGNTISVAEGLALNERVAINLPDEVSDGSRIQAVAATRR
ncbi:MAG: efflux RND transporter periplasmic adaptor subunit [Pseudomonadota bacterium]